MRGETFEAMTDSVIFGGLIFYSLTVGAVYVLRRTRRTSRAVSNMGLPLHTGTVLVAYGVAGVSEILPARRKLGIVADCQRVIYYAFARAYRRGAQHHNGQHRQLEDFRGTRTGHKLSGH
jgi:hypothetical protein